MNHKHLVGLIADLESEREALAVAIDYLRRRVQSTPGRDHAKAIRLAGEALDHLNGNGNAPPKKRKYTKRVQNPVFRGTGREVAELPIPSGVDLAGVEFPRAIALAVQAVGNPIPTPELTSLLERAKVKFPAQGKKLPPRRYVGMIAANLARDGLIKKTPTGWAKGKPA